MKKGLFFMAIACVFTHFSCKQTPSAKTTTDTVVEKTVAVVKEAAQNVLSEAETKEGYRLLFDGKTMKGWRNFKKQTIGKDWIVDSAAQAIALNVIKKADGHWQAEDGGDIITDDSYENYEFQVEWKIDTCGNSGIIYNVIEHPTAEYVWHTGPEMQVLDNKCHPDAKIIKHRAGDLYDLISSSSEPVRPALEWNQAKLIQNKGKVEHWLNGVKIVEYDMNKPEWKALIAKSKFAKMPLFGKSMKGHLSLQDHGNKVWYRNLKIKLL